MENDNDYLASLDRRVSDHDNKIAQGARDLTQLSLEIKQLLERINQGVSPSVNAVRQENSEIKLALADMKHKFELDMIDMKTMVRESTELTRSMLHNFETAKIAPLNSEIGFIKKTFIYGLVGAGVVFIGEKVMNVIWEKVFPIAPTAIVETHISGKVDH